MHKFIVFQNTRFGDKPFSYKDFCADFYADLAKVLEKCKYHHIDSFVSSNNDNEISKAYYFMKIVTAIRENDNCKININFLHLETLEKLKEIAEHYQKKEELPWIKRNYSSFLHMIDDKISGICQRIIHE